MHSVVRVSVYWWGGGGEGVGLQVNKSELVSSDDHQLSVVRGRYSEVQYIMGNGHTGGTPVNRKTPFASCNYKVVLFLCHVRETQIKC